MNRRQDMQTCAEMLNRIPSNIEQYRAVNLLFIEDVITESATHGAPLDEESQIIQHELSQLNRLDCITINSQPFEEDSVDGIIYRARPYLQFYYPRHKINQLIEVFMRDNTQTLVTIYAPNNKVIMYNDKLYTELSDSNGFLALHQDFINDMWVESFHTSFNPIYMKDVFEHLGLTNNRLLEYGRQHLVLVNIISMEFNNNMFQRLAQAAHSVFFL